MELINPRTPGLTVPTLQEAVAAPNSVDVNVDQQLLPQSASEKSVPNIAVADIPFPEAYSDGLGGEKWSSPPVARQGDCCCIGVRVRFLSCEFPLVHYIHLTYWLRHMWRWFDPLGFCWFLARLSLGLGCGLVHLHPSNLFISDIGYYSHCKVSGYPRDYFMYGFCIGYIVFIVL